MNEGALFRPRRPWGRWAIAGVAAIAVFAVLLYLLGGDDPGNVAIQDPTPSPSATSESPAPSESPSASPSPSAAPSASPTPAPTGTTTRPEPSPTRSRRPSRTPTARPGETGDGVPGWTAGSASCTQATRPGTSVAPAAGLTIELSLPTNTYRSGSTILGTVRVTNNGTQRVTFSTTDRGDDGTLLDAGRPVSGVYGQRPVVVNWTLDPGVSAQRQVTIQAEACGDTSTSPGTPLRTDRAYEAVVTLVHAGGRWSTPARSVTLFR